MVDKEERYTEPARAAAMILFWYVGFLVVFYGFLGSSVRNPVGELIATAVQLPLMIIWFFAVVRTQTQYLNKRLHEKTVQYLDSMREGNKPVAMKSDVRTAMEKQLYSTDDTTKTLGLLLLAFLLPESAMLWNIWQAWADPDFPNTFWQQAIICGVGVLEFVLYAELCRKENPRYLKTDDR